MSTHNIICFHVEIRKILTLLVEIGALSGAMSTCTPEKLRTVRL